MKIKIAFVIFIITQLSVSISDVYLHNPRGSNNRCDRRTNDRRNANRLFDSQNNAAGGYAAPCDRPLGASSPDNITCYQMNYYMDTTIPIRWTSQHNCGQNNKCQYIFQYSCEGFLADNVRDGHPQNELGNTCTDTIPEDLDEDILNPTKYGKHEDYAYYQRCKSRIRNKRLFTADQNLRGDTATYTRQNPNGNRYGFECPEERDYYPYWSHSPWVDIAILTSEESRCPYYINQSQCYQEKNDCIGLNDDEDFPNNQEECEIRGGHWTTHTAFDVQPEIPKCNISCISAPTSVINRLGIGNNSDHHQTFYWRIPTHTSNLTNCVLRLRYNITTDETPWEFSIDNNTQLKQNPVINTSSGVPVRLAINTAQYGRIFEDRTWTFNIIQRPINLLDKTIHNINVQGKRGNIAQVRNCIEYDFVPNNIKISEDDYLHFQWVGSDFNPHGNDGEGRPGTDRSNLVEINILKENKPVSNYSRFLDDYLSYQLASIGQDINNPDICYTYQELSLQNKRNEKDDLKNCALLNAAPPYFNMVPVKVNKTGKYYLISSRNNNFSNRGQKLKILATINTQTKTNFPNSPNSPSSTKSNKGPTISIIIASVICSFVIIAIIVLSVRYVRKRGGIRKIRIDIRRHFSSQV